MTDDEVIKSARGMILSWLGEWALMLRVDQTPDQLGLDAQNRVIERHIDYILSVRATMAKLWDWPPPPPPFPFQERTEDRTGLHGLDFGDGFMAVFCERENLLAMYPHVCPEPPAAERHVHHTEEPAPDAR